MRKTQKRSISLQGRVLSLKKCSLGPPIHHLSLILQTNNRFYLLQIYILFVGILFFNSFEQKINAPQKNKVPKTPFKKSQSQYFTMMMNSDVIVRRLVIIQMGGVQTSQNEGLLYENYTVIGEENEMKILQDKNSGEQFILKEQCFLHKNEYDAHFKKIREKQKQIRNIENTLKMVKLWSKEHNGVCSNIFKIYTVYQYPKVKLIDQIEARKTENKPFEETEILSIMQSSLNAFLAEPNHTNISPHLIFIVPEGILKIINADIADQHHRTAFSSQYYYSPEKMENFQASSHGEEREKEGVFSIGMTVLHCALLEGLGTCYELSSKRLNKKKLDYFKSKLTNRYSTALTQLILSLLDWDPVTRLGFNQVQTAINEMCSEQHSINSFTDNLNQDHKSCQFLHCEQNFLNLPINTHKKQQTLSVLSDINPNISQITLSTYVNPVRKSEFEIICDITNRNSMKKQVLLIQKAINTIPTTNNKENLFTDTRILDMIKDGLNKIEKTNKERSTMREIQNNHNTITVKPTPVSSSQDLLSQYQLNTSSKQKECIYLVQQYEDQSRYQGMVQNGMKNGFGKLIYPDGVFYQGNFKNDTLSGKGSLFYGQNRPAYIGDWQNNKFDGIGTLYNQYPILMQSAFDYSDFNKIDDQWIKFEGHFKQDVKEGIGKIVLTNGESIQAMFNCGVINGEGTFKDLNGRMIHGVWNGNKLVNIIQ